jgi:hypothetical protein
MARLINAAGFTWLRVTCTVKKQPRRATSTRIYRGQVLPPASGSRFTAGTAEFLNLSQCRVRR